MKTKFPKARKMGFTLLLATLLMNGCACQDRYEPALAQWQENLEALRPTVEKGTEHLPDEKLKQSKMGLLEDTINGIKRVRGAGPEVWSEGGDK